jgi:hypothetical protein
LLDSIDIHVEVQNVQYKDLTSDSACGSSEEIGVEVTKAREIQLKRFQGLKYSTNSRMSTKQKQIKKHCSLDCQAEELLYQAMTELDISARVIIRYSRSSGRLLTLITVRTFVWSRYQKPFSTEIWIVICGNDDYSLRTIWYVCTLTVNYLFGKLKDVIHLNHFSGNT